MEQQLIEVHQDEKSLVSLTQHVQGFNYWLDGFWKVIGGLFRRKDRVKVESHTFHKKGRHLLCPRVEHEVQKTWFHLTQPHDETKWNRANISKQDGRISIFVEVEEAPCTIKWFNIY